MKAILLLSSDAPVSPKQKSDKDRLLDFLEMWPIEDVLVLTTTATSPELTELLQGYQLLTTLKVQDMNNWIKNGSHS